MLWPVKAPIDLQNLKIKLKPVQFVRAYLIKVCLLFLRY